MTTLRDDLATVLHRHNMEIGSNTPDFILAQMVITFLNGVDHGIREREAWYQRKDNPRAIGTFHPVTPGTIKEAKEG